MFNLRVYSLSFLISFVIRILLEISRLAEEAISKNDDTAHVRNIAVVLLNYNCGIWLFNFNVARIVGSVCVWIILLETGLINDGIGQSEGWLIISLGTGGVGFELKFSDALFLNITSQHRGCFLLSSFSIVLINGENQETIFILRSKFDSI